MRIITLVAFMIGSFMLSAQADQDSILLNQIPILKDNVFQQRKEINELTRRLNNQNFVLNRQKKSIDSIHLSNTLLINAIDSLNGLIENKSTELGDQIQLNEVSANNQIAALDSNVENVRLNWIIGSGVFLAIIALIYWFLGNKISSNKSDVESQIKKTKAALEEESVKLDNKLISVLETQLKLKEEEVQNAKEDNNTDHSLALKVADEIVRIQKNLSRMEQGTKGLKQLNGSVKRIQANFASNGYELVEMVGKEYHEGMKLSANFIPSDKIETGKQIITRIIKPQVNFKGVMIQAAQIEVSVGE